MSRRRLALAALILSVALALTGCWDYRSLHNIAVVLGMSIDRDEASGAIRLCFEIADVANSSDKGIGSRLIEAEGATIFDAVRTAKRRLVNKLYFAHMQIVVIGEQVAREFGINGLIDWCMRDAEVRENTIVLIAKGVSGRAMLETKSIDQRMVSIEAGGILMEDNDVTSSSVNLALYQAFDILNGAGRALTLPVLSVAVNDAKPTAEADGAAIFSGDHLVGFLSAEETKYFLLAQGKAKGGILTLDLGAVGYENTSLEIADTETALSYRIEDGKITAVIHTDTTVFLAENMSNLDVMNQMEIAFAESQAGEKIASGIAALLTREQGLHGEDILGVGAKINAGDYKLWRELAGDWRAYYAHVAFEVESRVRILNSATITSREDISK